MFVIKYSWLIPLFINVSDILLSMLFNLLLANITILLCFLSFSLTVFFTFPVEIENARLIFALVILTGAPITVGNDAKEMLPNCYR